MTTEFSNTQEFQDIMHTFERTHRHISHIREKRGTVPAGFWYCDGYTNQLFKAYLEGYMLGKRIAQEEKS